MSPRLFLLIILSPPTILRLVTRLRMNGAILYSPLHTFMECVGFNFYLPTQKWHLSKFCRNVPMNIKTFLVFLLHKQHTMTYCGGTRERGNGGPFQAIGIRQKREVRSSFGLLPERELPIRDESRVLRERVALGNIPTSNSK
jgi:hypothetical protein